MTYDAPLRDPDVAALRARRDALAAQFITVGRADEQARAAYARLGERLRTLNRERAVARHERHALQSELALLKRKCETLEENIRHYAPDYLTQQAAFRSLTAQVRLLQERIDDTEQEIAELTTHFDALEAEMFTGQQRLAELEEEKNKIVEEIATRLKRTSLDRDKIEKDLNAVALEFRDVVAARDETFQVHSENQESLDALTEETGQHERRIDELERMQALNAERKKLGEEVQAKAREVSVVRETMSGVQRQLITKKARLQGMVNAAEDNERQAAEIERLVGPYRKARSEMQARQAQCDASAAALGRYGEELGDMLATLPELEEELRVLAHKLARIAEAAEQNAAA